MMCANMIYGMTCTSCILLMDSLKCCLCLKPVSHLDFVSVCALDCLSEFNVTVRVSGRAHPTLYLFSKFYSRRSSYPQFQISVCLFVFVDITFNHLNVNFCINKNNLLARMKILTSKTLNTELHRRKILHKCIRSLRLGSMEISNKKCMKWLETFGVWCYRRIKRRSWGEKL